MSAGNICDITINSIHTALLIISRSLLNLNDFFQWLFAGMCVRRRQSLALHKHGSDGKTLPKIVQWSVQRGTYLLLLSVVFLWNDNSEIFNLLLKKQTNCLMAARDDHVKFLFHIYLNINAGLKLWKLLEQWYENLISCFSIYKKKLCHQSIDFFLLARVMPSHEWREMHDLNFHSSIFLPHTLWWTFNYASWFVSMCAPLWECASNNFTLQCEWTVFSLFPQISYTRRGAMLEVQLTFREKLREQISTWCKSPSICSSGG